MSNKNPVTYPAPVTVRTTSTNDPMEFLSRGWSLPVLEMANPMAGFGYGPQIKDGSFGGVSLSPSPEDEIGDDVVFDDSTTSSVAANTFPFASSVTSQLVMDRIMSQSEVSPLTSGRPSHSSGPLNGGGSLTESPPLSPSTLDEANKHCVGVANPVKPSYRGGSKTVGRWLKDRKEKKKEETRVHNAQLHAAVSVAGVAAAVAAIAAATAAASRPGKDDQLAKTDMAVASAATLVAAQLVEAAESMGVEREHLASVVHSAVNVRTASDVVTLTAAAATALRGAATLKARALKDVWNIATVIPVDKSGIGCHHRHISNVDEVISDDNSTISLADQELLGRGTDLVKRTRKGDLHRKIVSIHVNKSLQVVLKMKSRHVVGAITKKKKYVVVEVCKDIKAWSQRSSHLQIDGKEQRRYFGLKTADQRVIEFECRSPKEFIIWTNGVSCLLNMLAEKKAGRRI